MMRETEEIFSYSNPKTQRGTKSELPRFKKPKLSRKLLLQKCSRVLVSVICTGFFFYYLTVFFQMYGKYPTVIDVSVFFPDIPDLPAITFCDHNVLRKSQACEEPSPCTDLENNTRNFSQTLRKRLATLTMETILNWTIPSEDFVVKCRIANSQGKMRDISLNISELPWIYFEKRVCYAMNVDWAKHMKFDFNDTDSEFVVILDFHPEESFRPNNTAAEIFIHAPIGLPDSRTSHFLARGGKSISVGIQKTTVNLLEEPYQTKCTNYTKRYSQGNKAQLSKKVCYTQCMAGKAFDSCQCVPECMLFMESYKTLNYTACINDTSDQERCCESAMLKREECQKDCPLECMVRLYDLQVDEKDEVFMHEDAGGLTLQPVRNENYDDKRFGEIRINLQLVRHTIYQHNPKITEIEILGYIGGYLGIWLGVSIPLLYDRTLTLLDTSRQIICGKKKLIDAIHVHQPVPATPPMPTSQQLYGVESSLPKIRTKMKSGLALVQT